MTIGSATASMWSWPPPREQVSLFSSSYGRNNALIIWQLMSWFTRSVTSLTDFYIRYLLLKSAPISHKKETSSKQSGEPGGSMSKKEKLNKLKKNVSTLLFSASWKSFYLDIILQEKQVRDYLKNILSWCTHRHHGSSEANNKQSKSGWWPGSWKSFHLPWNH